MVGENLQSAVRIHRDVEVSRQSVATSTGDDAERNICMDKASGYFIDRPIASDGNYNVSPLLDGLAYQLCGMSLALRIAECPPETLAVEVFRDKVNDMPFV